MPAMLSYKPPLYPTTAQVALLRAMLGAFRDLHNAAPQPRIEAYRRQGKTLRYGHQKTPGMTLNRTVALKF